MTGSTENIWAQYRLQIEQSLLDKSAEITLIVDGSSWRILGARGPLSRVLDWEPEDLIDTTYRTSRSSGTVRNTHAPI